MEQQSLQDLIGLLDLEEIEKNHYRATSPNEGWQRVYGGQVIGQALVAASRTVDEDRHAHSLHGYFLRPGAMHTPILYKVDRIRDGRSFTTRHVVAIQNGQAIFNMSISFQVDEDGLTHQIDMPTAPAPGALPDEAEVRERHYAELQDPPRWDMSGNDRNRPIEIHPVDPVNIFLPQIHAPEQMCWMRSRERLPDDRRLHQCVLAYLSDWSLIDTSMMPHAVSFTQTAMQVASLDHAMWFHHPFRADEWLLYVQDSPAASGGRGLNRGLIYNEAGLLVASAAQEGLIRVHDK
ncbi:MAG: acyl-CoA thioesterase II [Pseudomonadales bacterium]|jgi:acyl-CoA thioesterase-2|nr:acyl-CoA thioesterase II [Pseudomonadales bacterium]MDP6470268.1 acyl-CoA thioesterase II [Pseudomonadales bacterium]MDP6827174.1 acyl-CoA thioesterase II [Pseudomonadales bacterium]MDP6972395.1 acyl-CoA thioesterase II [Pseudomonadales bacterium]|tara:strand:- start:1293 stop:2168 length:876 start_codon:yes stop_codon:yes gene_type:complete